MTIQKRLFLAATILASVSLAVPNVNALSVSQILKLINRIPENQKKTKSYRGTYQFRGNVSVTGKNSGNIKIRRKKIIVDLNKWSKTTIRLNKRIKRSKNRPFRFRSMGTGVIPAMPEKGQLEAINYGVVVVMRLDHWRFTWKGGSIRITLSPNNVTSIKIIGQIERGRLEPNVGVGIRG